MATYYTQAEAAERLGLTRQRVNRLVSDGRIPTVEPIPGVKRITAAALARFARQERPHGVWLDRKKTSGNSSE